MKTFGFLVGLFSIVGSTLLAISFFNFAMNRKHILFHHDGVLLMAICGIALGAILMVLCESSER